MTNLSAILENPFHQIGANSTDDRRKLIALADEASLMGGEETEAALNLLLHHQRRLEAEINWFPNADPAQIDALLNYVERKEVAPFPVLSSNSALAQFNACRALLESWPVRDESGAFAICHSLAIVDAAIRPEQLLAELNSDREKGGFLPLEDADGVAYRLDDLRRSVAARLEERLGAVERLDYEKLILRLAELYRKLRSPLIEMLVSDYDLRNSEEINRLGNEMKKLAKDIIESEVEHRRDQLISDMMLKLQRWDHLTRAGRMIQNAKGIKQDLSKELQHDLREAAVELHNKHHKTEQSLRVIRDLKRVFWDVPGAQEMFQSDVEALEKMVRQIEELRRRLGAR